MVYISSIQDYKMQFNLFLYSKSILLLIAVIIATVQTLWTEFEWVGIENSKTGIVITDLKVMRYNKTTFSVTGPCNFTADLNDDYDVCTLGSSIDYCELKAYFSSKGNNQYVLLPYKLPRDACCKHLDSEYWKTVESRLQESSNIPPRNGKDPFCLSMKKGVYTMRQFAFDHNVIFKFVETGTYKAEIILYKKQSEKFSSMGTFTARLY